MLLDSTARLCPVPLSQSELLSTNPAAALLRIARPGLLPAAVTNTGGAGGPYRVLTGARGSEGGT